MIVLTEQVLEGILATILAVDPKYIVPRQGNWWNAQEAAQPLKPATWCGYALEDETPIDLPHYVQDSATPPANWMVQHKRAWLALQFIGAQAKALASTVGMWVGNQVAIDQFALIDGRIAGASGRVTPVVYSREGGNTVLAYTARVLVIYAAEVETGQDVLQSATFQGVVSVS